jgi:hypothetical protein
MCTGTRGGEGGGESAEPCLASGKGSGNGGIFVDACPCRNESTGCR